MTSKMVANVRNTHFTRREIPKVGKPHNTSQNKLSPPRTAYDPESSDSAFASENRESLKPSI